MSEPICEYKECTIVNGELWNIGPWDYQYRLVQTGIDKEDNPILEEVATYPFPENGVIEHRWFEYTADRGWYEVGKEPNLNSNDAMNRNFVDIFKLLVEKNILAIHEVPQYQEYDYRTAVQHKMSESDA